MEEFDSVLGALESQRPAGLVIRSAKKSGFIAGADVNEFRGVTDPRAVEAAIGRAHAVIDRLEALRIPTVAVIHGFCLGGGISASRAVFSTAPPSASRMRPPARSASASPLARRSRGRVRQQRREAQRLARKVVKGKSFDMSDLKSQLEQLQNMDGVGALLDKLPGAAVGKAALSSEQGDRELRRQIAIINSMTPRERRNPALIDGSRRRRIAAGSGMQVQDVNRLLKQFLEMQRVMKSMKGGRLRGLMGALKGGMPPGFPRR